jgi:hypothetical protein
LKGLQEGFGKSMQQQAPQVWIVPQPAQLHRAGQPRQDAGRAFKYFRFQLFLGLLEITDTTAFLPVLPLHP